MPACHVGLSAKVLEQAGLKSGSAAVYGPAGSLLGMPDIAVLTGSEMITQYTNICEAANLPVFVDIDTGFGDGNNVIPAVGDCEKAGVAGLFIEDQTYPKSCGHMAGKKAVSVEVSARRAGELFRYGATESGFNNSRATSQLYRGTPKV